MRKILILLVIPLFAGCIFNIDSKVKKEVISTNISPKNEIFSKIECNKESLLLIGNSENNINSVFYETSLNNLKKWNFSNINILKGRNTSFSSDTENYYFVNYKKNLSSNIISVNKKSKKSKIINTIDSIFINFSHFENKENSYIIIGNKFKNKSLNSKNFKLFKYSKNSLVDSLVLNCNVLKPIFEKGFIYFKSSKSRIERINISNLTRDSIEIENIEIIDFQVIEKDNYLILGKQNAKTILVQIKNGNTIIDKTLPTEIQNLTGRKVHYYKGFKALLVNEIDESLLLGLGGSKYTLLISYDKSNKWKEIELPIDYYVRPSLFYKNEIFIAYSGGAELTYINFKEDLNK